MRYRRGGGCWRKKPEEWKIGTEEENEKPRKKIKDKVRKEKKQERKKYSTILW